MRVCRLPLIAVVLVFLALPVFAQQHPEMAPESYTGVAMVTGGTAGGASMPFDFRITSYTTDEELDNYAQLLKEKGQDALLRVLEKQDCGRIQPVGSTGNQIALARKSERDGETIITIVTARKMSLGELYNNGRSVDYPFGFLQVKLDPQGNGTGQFVIAAKLSFNKKQGDYEIESFGNQYVKASNVRLNK